MYGLISSAAAITDSRVNGRSGEASDMMELQLMNKTIQYSDAAKKNGEINS